MNQEDARHIAKLEEDGWNILLTTTIDTGVLCVVSRSADTDPHEGKEAEAPHDVYRVVRSVNVRKAPGISGYTVVGKLKAGAKVSVDAYFSAGSAYVWGRIVRPCEVEFMSPEYDGEIWFAIKSKPGGTWFSAVIEK